MNEIDVIKGAREILASGHWHKGALEDGVGGCCIIGALHRVAGVDWSAAAELLEAQLDRKRPANQCIGEMLAEYNDSGTTLQDMLDLIDKTLADMGAL